MRKEYEMTQADLDKILEACKPVPAILFAGLGGPMPRTPQENANDAWKELGERMGFGGMTVQPASKGQLLFTAEEAKVE